MKKPVSGIVDNNILTPAQKSFLAAFTKSELRDVFRLTGGAALSAFYLKHRLSEDLDFFSNEKVPLNILEGFLKSVNIVKEISFSKLFDRNIFSLKIKDGSFLKVEFTESSLMNIEDYALVDHLMIDSLLDLTVNKLCAIADRFDAKDYVDLYCVLKSTRFSLKNLIELAEKKYDIKGVRHVLKSRLLQTPPGIDKLPLLMVLTENEIKACFEKLIKDIIAAENP